MAQITIAANEKILKALFEAARDKIQINLSDDTGPGTVTVGYSIKAHLENGSIDLQSDNTIKVSELDITWDVLDLIFELDLPEKCIGGFCIIPSPFGGCILRAPKICIFEDDPDIKFTMSLGGIITSEISFIADLRTKYNVNPALPYGMNPWDAQDSVPSLANHWQIFLNPFPTDIDLFDVPEMVHDLLDGILNAVIDTILSPLPGWAKDLIRYLFGSLIDIIRDILDIPDDINEWIKDILINTFGLNHEIRDYIFNNFMYNFPVHEIEDPYPMLGAKVLDNNGTPELLVPVKVPVQDLKAYNNDQEIIIEANIGVLS